MFSKKPRTRSSVRTILSVAGMTLAVAVVPASASAAVRTLSVEDPQGDAAALSGPELDLESIAYRYDDAAGTLRVTWTYYHDIRNETGGLSVMGGLFQADRPIALNVASDMVHGSWSITSGNASASLSLSTSGGSLLPGTATISPDGLAVTADFSHEMLAGHDWQYSWGTAPIHGDQVGDGMTKFWFDGFSDPRPPQPPVGPVGPLPVPPPPSDGGATDADQSMTINGGAQFTNDPDVTLSVIAPSWADRLRVANDGGFRDAEIFAVRKKIRWRLAESGPERLPKTVYLRFGSDAQNFTDDIILDQTSPTVTSATVDGTGAAATSAVAATTAAATRPTYRVQVRAKDANSGVARVQFARSKRHPTALAKLERINRYKGTHAPKYVRVKDRAGNYSRWRSIR